MSTCVRASSHLFFWAIDLSPVRLVNAYLYKASSGVTGFLNVLFTECQEENIWSENMSLLFSLVGYIYCAKRMHIAYDGMYGESPGVQLYSVQNIDNIADKI